MFECWNDLCNLSDMSSQLFYADSFCQSITLLIELLWEIKAAVTKSVISWFLNEGSNEIGEIFKEVGLDDNCFFFLLSGIG